ncbi:MAG: GNAT family N-acetyltransferase [Acetobacteraceae bacterium]|nr:GNAT family N-acetyltransferase [Acetobacteraceae bacterium]
MLRANPRRFRPECLFQPRSVAVLGAGTELGRVFVRNLHQGKFAGELQAVDTAGQLAAPPELAIIATPALQAELDALAEMGVAAAIAAATGDYRPTSCRVLGPGAFGVIVPGSGLNASSAHLPARPGKLALVSPSAALCRTVLDWAEPNGVGLSHVVGTGLETDIDAATVLDFLSREPGTGAILLDIRTIRDRRAFLSSARAAAMLRPVVAIRAGAEQRDPTGRSGRVFEAALRRAGILHVTTMAELLAAAEILTRARPPRAETLMIVTNAIGAGRLAADHAVRMGIPLASPDAAARTLLEMHLPPQPPDPGLIWTGDDHPTRPAEAVAMLSALPEIGGIAAVLAPTGEADAAGVAALAAAQRALRAPLVASVLGETTGAVHRRTLADAGVPVFASPEQAVRAFAQLIMQRRARAAARELPSSRVLRLAPDKEVVRRILADARRAGRDALFQDEALDVLAAYGIPVVPGRPVAGPEEAADAAALLGFPAVVKQRRTDPEKAAIRLDLPDENAVAQAAARLPAADGLLIQRQAGRARRVRITVTDDELFGPAIGFGPGGRDRLNEAAFELPPLNVALAGSLVARSQAARLLAAGQGHPAANVDAVADVLVRVSQLIVDAPEIASLVIDPLFADESGVSAAEAWLRLRPPGQAGLTAIAPYPAQLAEHWPTHGETLEIRPIRPEDAQAHIALFKRLPPEDVRYRFFSPLRDLPPERIARLTQVDYDREMAIIAVRDGETVGVARLVREPPGTEAEFAVLVDPAMKGRGVGRHLMQRIIDWGRSCGLTAITGQILADNAPMLAFARGLGFQLSRQPEEPDVVDARMNL